MTHPNFPQLPYTSFKVGDCYLSTSNSTFRVLKISLHDSEGLAKPTITLVNAYDADHIQLERPLCCSYQKNQDYCLLSPGDYLFATYPAEGKVSPPKFHPNENMTPAPP
jgi:hypothetical protein